MRVGCLTIVAFGDSITNAVGHFGVTEETCFRGRLGQRLREELQRPVEVINAGVNGDITPLALARMESDVCRHEPDIVTVMFGVNDAGFYRPATGGFADTPRVEIGEFTTCLRQIVERIQSLPARAVLLTPLPMNEHYWGTQHPPYVAHGLNYLVEQYAHRVRDVASSCGVPLVDTFGYFASHPETADLVPDGIHPNPEGHRLIADLLAPVVKECVR